MRKERVPAMPNRSISALPKDVENGCLPLACRRASNPCSVVDSHPRRIVSLEEFDSVASFIVEWSNYVISCVFCILIAVILTLGFVFSDYLTTAVSLFMAA